MTTQQTICLDLTPRQTEQNKKLPIFIVSVCEVCYSAVKNRLSSSVKTDNFTDVFTLPPISSGIVPRLFSHVIHFLTAAVQFDLIFSSLPSFCLPASMVLILHFFFKTFSYLKIKNPSILCGSLVEVYLCFLQYQTKEYYSMCIKSLCQCKIFYVYMSIEQLTLSEKCEIKLYLKIDVVNC